MAMTLRLTEEQDRELALLAEAEGISKHEAILRAISEAAVRRVREGRVAELSERGRDRYAALIARLAE